MRIFTLLLLFTSITTLSSAQHTISGVVIDTISNTPLPGVTVFEDSTNQTITDQQGRFSIELNKIPSQLTFAFIGMLTRTIDVNSDGDLNVYIKPFTLTHYFDSQKLGFFISSGVLNTPIGGKLILTSPNIFDQLVIKSSVNYQTNMEDNDFILGSVALDNIITGQHFGLGITGYYHEVEFESYELKNKSVDFDFFIRRIPFNFSIGYSKLNIVEENIKTTHDGLTFGVNRYFSEPSLSVSSKILLYEGLIGFEAELQKSIKRINLFTRYQQLDSFSEVSLGFGYIITYILNDPNKY